MMNNIQRLNVEEIIIARDLNTILSSQDKKGGHGCHHPKCTSYLNEAMVELSLIDIWRTHNPEAFRFTWTRGGRTPLMERLDYFLISSCLQYNVMDADILPSYMSDHSIPTLYLRYEDLLA